MSANVSRLPQRNLRARAGESSGARDFLARAETAAAIAERFADAVDRDARFPAEAFAAIREQKLLGMLIPSELGGEGARAADVADVCAMLGRACASTAMIFAMHQVKVACLVRHARGNAWQLGLQRRIAERQMLLSSSTTEGNNGGDIRSSEAAVRINGARVTLQRDASCISYALHADGLVTTARRSDAAASSDQVLVAFLSEDYTPRADARLGHARHARHLQRGIHRPRRGRMRSSPAGALRAHPQPDDGALRASLLEFGLVRNRRPARCGARAPSCARLRDPRADACRRPPRI